MEIVHGWNPPTAAVATSVIPPSGVNSNTNVNTNVTNVQEEEHVTKRRIDALKYDRLHVDELPSVLQLHLMRYAVEKEEVTWGLSEGKLAKIHDRFEFPKKLNLSELCTHNNTTTTSSSISKDKSKKARKHKKRSQTPSQYEYDLQSVVVHSGEYGTGHYRAYVRPNIHTNAWYLFDDHKVTRVRYREVKRDAFGIGSGSRSGSGERSSSKGEGEGSRCGDTTVTMTKNGWFGSRKRGGEKGERSESGGSCAYLLQYVKRCDIPVLYGKQS